MNRILEPAVLPAFWTICTAARRLFPAVIALIAATPSFADAPDLAARMRGKEVYMAVKDAAVTDAVKRFMPEADFEVWLKWAAMGVSTPMEEHQGIVYGFGCQPHNCAVTQSLLAVDHTGRAWAGIVDGDTVRFFGEPTDTMKVLMRP